MGDRGNIAFVDRRSFEGKENVGYTFLYTHWGGSGIQETLQAALLHAPDRWTDPQYLTRVTFCKMVEDSVGETTGYGIGPFIGDNEHPILLVDCDKQMIYEVYEHVMERAALMHEEIVGAAKTWTFKEFAEFGASDGPEIPE